jgi:hypothetical protein
LTSQPGEETTRREDAKKKKKRMKEREGSGEIALGCN